MLTLCDQGRTRKHEGLFFFTRLRSHYMPAKYPSKGKKGVKRGETKTRKKENINEKERN